MRPPSKEEEYGDLIVEKISSNSVSILDHTFTFDSVADTSSTQVNLKRHISNLKAIFFIALVLFNAFELYH